MAKVGSWLARGAMVLLVAGCGGTTANGGTGGTGASADAGDAPDATASASGGGATLACQEIVPQACDCRAGAPDCFVLSDAIQGCGLLEAPAPGACTEDLVASGSLGADECDCEGRSCAEGQTCRRYAVAPSDPLTSGSVHVCHPGDPAWD